MSKTNKAKRYSAEHSYRRIGELLNRTNKLKYTTKQQTVLTCPYCLREALAGETILHRDGCRCKGMS